VQRDHLHTKDSSLSDRFYPGGAPAAYSPTTIPTDPLLEINKSPS